MKITRPGNVSPERLAAEQKLAAVLGNGNATLYARYVHSKTYKLPIEQLSHLAKVFTEGWQGDFEKAVERLEGTNRMPFDGRKSPIFYNQGLIMPWEKKFPWDAS